MPSAIVRTTAVVKAGLLRMTRSREAEVGQQDGGSFEVAWTQSTKTRRHEDHEENP
jgi:hypothetical protein